MAANMSEEELQALYTWVGLSMCWAPVNAAALQLPASWHVGGSPDHELPPSAG